MKTLILCKSVHHQNTALVAHAMARVLQAEIRDPEDTPVDCLSDYDLVGFGSGIYFGRFHAAIRAWIGQLPNKVGNTQMAFLFSTAGLPSLWRLWHRPMKSLLSKKGWNVVAEFHCSGFDTFGPLWLVGGIHRRHPNQQDQEHAAEFARRLISSVHLAQSADSLMVSGAPFPRMT